MGGGRAARLGAFAVFAYAGWRKKGAAMAGKPGRGKSRAIYLLLLVPFAAVLWVPFYNRAEPALFGIPFYYWYQMLWVVLGAAALVPVYLYEERHRK
jgi:hypothetical protein